MFRFCSLSCIRSRITPFRCERILLFMLLVGVPLVCWGEQLWTVYPWLEPVAAVLSALVVAVMFQDSFRREAESLLRQHWASLNGSRKKE